MTLQSNLLFYTLHNYYYYDGLVYLTQLRSVTVM